MGYGRIGQALGRRCQALGMKVLAYDVYQNRDLECDTMRYVELDELLAQSDIISLHVPSLPGQPLINAKTIARMKDGVILINTSRGTNVDEEALLAALESGKVYGAGLDVFAEEPPKNAALLATPPAPVPGQRTRSRFHPSHPAALRPRSASASRLHPPPARRRPAGGKVWRFAGRGHNILCFPSESATNSCTNHQHNMKIL